MGLWQRAQVLSFSRRDFCSHPSYEQATPKNFAASRPSSDQPGSGVAGFITIGHGARTNERKKKKGSRTPKGACHRRTCKVRRAPCGARSPSGVPLRLSPGRQLVPKAQRQATLRGRSGAFGPGTAAPTGGRRPCALPRALPAPQTRPSSSEHLACRSLCRQVDARAARVQRGRTLCPRAPQPAPPAGVTGRRPFKQAG